jgi:hypothetical protein
MPKGTEIYIISGPARRSQISGPYMPSDLTADSEPDFDNWGPDSYWSCHAFLEWYKLMKAKYGKDYARSRFLSAYETAFSFGSYHQSCCQDNNFRNFFTSEGIDVNTLFCAIISPTIDTAQTVAEGTFDIAKFIKTAAPFVLGAVVIGGVIYGYNTYVKPSYK